MISKLNVRKYSLRLMIPLDYPSRRFRKLFLPRYTEEEFIQVTIKVLPKISENLARYIGYTVFKNGGDIRDVISIGKLVRKTKHCGRDS